LHKRDERRQADVERAADDGLRHRIAAAEGLIVDLQAGFLKHASAHRVDERRDRIGGDGADANRRERRRLRERRARDLRGKRGCPEPRQRCAARKRHSEKP